MTFSNRLSVPTRDSNIGWNRIKEITREVNKRERVDGYRSSTRQDHEGFHESHQKTYACRRFRIITALEMVDRDPELSLPEGPGEWPSALGVPIEFDEYNNLHHVSDAINREDMACRIYFPCIPSWNLNAIEAWKERCEVSANVGGISIAPGNAFDFTVDGQTITIPAPLTVQSVKTMLESWLVQNFGGWWQVTVTINVNGEITDLAIVGEEVDEVVQIDLDQDGDTIAIIPANCRPLYNDKSVVCTYCDPDTGRIISEFCPEPHYVGKPLDNWTETTCEDDVLCPGRGSIEVFAMFAGKPVSTGHRIHNAYHMACGKPGPMDWVEIERLGTCEWLVNIICKTPCYKTCTFNGTVELGVLSNDGVEITIEGIASPLVIPGGTNQATFDQMIADALSSQFFGTWNVNSNWSGSIIDDVTISGADAEGCPKSIEFVSSNTTEQMDIDTTEVPEC